MDSRRPIEATTALVTGATDGLGRSVAIALAGRGANVLVHGRDAPTGQKVGGEANTFDVRYDVRRGPDGTAAFHFGESGAKFADGWHAADRLGFTSGRQCKWF